MALQAIQGSIIPTVKGFFPYFSCKTTAACEVLILTGDTLCLAVLRMHSSAVITAILEQKYCRGFLEHVSPDFPELTRSL